jgi:hypothetical protein
VRATCAPITARAIVEQELGFTASDSRPMIDAYAALDPVTLGRVYERLALFRQSYINQELVARPRLAYGREGDVRFYEAGRFREWVESAILRRPADDPALVKWDRLAHLRGLAEGDRDGHTRLLLAEGARDVLGVEAKGRSTEMAHDGYEAALTLATTDYRVEGVEPALRALEKRLSDSEFGDLWTVQVALLNHGTRPERSLRALIASMRGGNNLAKNLLAEVEARLKAQGGSLESLVNPAELAELRAAMVPDA